MQLPRPRNTIPPMHTQQPQSNQVVVSLGPSLIEVAGCATTFEAASKKGKSYVNGKKWLWRRERRHELGPDYEDNSE